MKEFVIVFLVCVFFIMWGVIGRLIATRKGINPVGGFLGGLFLGPLVFLMFLCSPMKR